MDPLDTWLANSTVWATQANYNNPKTPNPKVQQYKRNTYVFKEYNWISAQQQAHSRVFLTLLAYEPLWKKNYTGSKSD